MAPGTANMFSIARKFLSTALIAGLTGLAALGLLAAAEALLRARGYGFPTASFIADHDTAPPRWRDNPFFARRFFPGPWLPDTAPVQVPVMPPGNSLRVAVLGESAAYGYPDPAFGFPRMLEATLEHQYPERQVEVINAALSGVSATVLLESLRDVLRMRPDVVVLYTGNNEFIGPFGAGTPGQDSLPPAWRVRLQVLASRLRLTQWVRPAQDDPTTDTSNPMASQSLSPDDPRVAATEARYQATLRAMIEAAAAEGIPVVLCTVAVNERGWAPFGSAHRVNLDASAQAAWQQAWADGEAAWAAGDAAGALAAWQRAEALDDAPATLHFALARALTKLGRCDEAEALYARACAQDTLRYRTTPAMNDRVRELVKGLPAGAVHLADCAAELRVPCESAHAPLFYDHCHLTPEGNYRVAASVRAAMDTVLPPPAAPAPSVAALLDRLAWTPWHAQANLRYVQYLAAKPPYPGRFEHAAWLEELDGAIADLAPQTTPEALRALAPALDAMHAAHPDDVFLALKRAQVHYAAKDAAGAAVIYQALTVARPAYATAWRLLAGAESAAGNHIAAAAAWRAASRLRPDHREWTRSLAATLIDADQPDEARRTWRSLVALDPTDHAAWWGLAQSYEQVGDYAAAIAVYREALVALPEHAGFHYYLAKALAVTGQGAQAREAAARGLQLAPGDPGLQALVATLGP
jgi:predicted Zn-dependent protease